MVRKFSELYNKMSPKRRAEVEKRVAETLAALPLDKVRKARNMTQVALAEKLHVDQGSISKLENRTDVYISTLREYVEALGGELILRAEFPEGSVNIELQR